MVSSGAGARPNRPPHRGRSASLPSVARFGTLDEVAATAGLRRAPSTQFPSKGAFLLGLFEQYAAVAGGSGARQRAGSSADLQFAAHATRDPLLRRRFAVVLAERLTGNAGGQLLMALRRVLLVAQPPRSSVVAQRDIIDSVSDLLE